MSGARPLWRDAIALKDWCARIRARDFSRIDTLTIASMLPGVADDYLDMPYETECQVAQLKLNYVRYLPEKARENTVADGICQANRRGLEYPLSLLAPSEFFPLITPCRAPRWC